MENNTEFHSYMENMSKFNQLILNILDKENDLEEPFQNLNKYFEENNTFKDKNQMKLILHAISSISNDHHRSHDHFNKIEQILKIFTNPFKQFFDNIEIFNIFKENKRILLFLFEYKLLTPDKDIFDLITDDKYDNYKYCEFFLPEFESFHSENYLKLVNHDYKSEEFLKKRKVGENDDEISSIIRNDSIDEFIEKTKDRKSYDKNVKTTIFETNPFLYKDKISFIEYSAFFGSIKILKHLLNNEENKYDIKYSLLSYAVHSNNDEVIHFIEEKIEEKKKKYDSKKSDFYHLFADRSEADKEEKLKKCFIESVKSHHINIINYLFEKYFKEKEIKSELPLYCLRFYNFISFNDQSIENMNDMFCVLCESDYISLVELFLKSKNLNVNSLIILI